MEYKLIARAVPNPSDSLVRRQRTDLAELRSCAPAHTLKFWFWSFNATVAVPARFVADGNVVFDGRDRLLCAYTQFFLRSETPPSEFLLVLTKLRAANEKERLVRTAILSSKNRLIRLCDNNEVGWWRFYFNEEERAIIEGQRGNAKFQQALLTFTREMRFLMDDVEMQYNAELLRRAGY